jgi:hypothetical protein
MLKCPASKLLRRSAPGHLPLLSVACLSVKPVDKPANFAACSGHYVFQSKTSVQRIQLNGTCSSGACA